MEYHKEKLAAVYRDLKSSKEGLRREEAGRRLKEAGYNELREERKKNPLKMFLNQFRSFLIIVLIAASVISLFIGNFIDASVILIIIIINAVMGFAQEYKAEKAMEALKRIVRSSCFVVRDGKREEIGSRMLVPGDMVVLEEGSKVPADIRLIESAGLKVDESSLTGESHAVSKFTGIVGNVQLADRKNMVYMGTVISSGRCMGIVVSTGMRTEMGKIAKMIQTAERKKTPLQVKLDRFGRHLGILILFISALVVAVGIIRGSELLDAFITGIALAVAAIPEGLPAVITITLAIGLQKMAKKNAVVRKLSAVETLGSTNVICSDKTGTLTRNEMVAAEIFANGEVYSVTGKGYEPRGSLRDAKGRKVPGSRIERLLHVSMLCNNSEVRRDSDWKVIGDSTEGALKVLARKFIDSFKSERLHEIPFTSERKRMETVDKISGKYYVHSKGAAEVILASCDRMMVNGRVRRLSAEMRKDILEKNDYFAGKALRVLALAYKEVRHIDKDERRVTGNLVFLGLVGMMDLPRQGVAAAVETCKHAGIRVVMITGDHKETAMAIARGIGIMNVGENVLTGEELGKMSEVRLAEVIESTSVFARVNPLDKVKILKAFKSKGYIVAMTGDGVNDAPALKKADIGVSMGLKGTDVAKEASDMVLKDDNFSTIVHAIEGGRIIYDNILKFVRNLLSSNLGEVLLIFFALIINFTDPETGKFILPLTAVQILWINLVTDGLPSIALGIDNPEKDIMKRRPRNPKDHILSFENLHFIVLAGFVTAMSSLLIFWYELPYGVQRAQTIAFTALVIAEMFNVFNSRSTRISVFSRDSLPNKYLMLAIASTIILQIMVIYVPVLRAAFGTIPLGLPEWAKIFVVSFAVVLAAEIWKLARKR